MTIWRVRYLNSTTTFIGTSIGIPEKGRGTHWSAYGKRSCRLQATPHQSMGVCLTHCIAQPSDTAILPTQVALPGRLAAICLTQLDIYLAWMSMGKISLALDFLWHMQACQSEQLQPVLEVAALDESYNRRLCLAVTRASLASPCSQTPPQMGPASLFEHRISLRNHSYSLRNPWHIIRKRNREKEEKKNRGTYLDSTLRDQNTSSLQ